MLNRPLNLRQADEQATDHGRSALCPRFAQAFRTPVLAAFAAVCFLFTGLGPAPTAQAASNSAAGASDSPLESSKIPGIKDYLDTSAEPVEVSSLGIMVRDGHTNLSDGESISGAQVVGISPHSPAAESFATHEVSHMLVNGALLGAGVASAILFPPAIIAVAMIAHSHVGMSYDLVVGIDGCRVRNTIDLMQSIANIRPGDTLYVVVVRRGRRVQVPVHLPQSG
jgi:S1-C subfamily serine protease